MSPFRDAPPVELGPLDVGLAAAARRAIAALPKGGRLIVPHQPRFAAHLAGTAGSVGLFAVLLSAVLARSSHWSPHSVSDLGLCALAVLLGGGSLAAVMHGLDRNRSPLTSSGEDVGRHARSVLDRLIDLAERAQRTPHELTAPDIVQIALALASAATLEQAPWIPDDVRGRAQLLLARTTATLGGRAWAASDALRDHVRARLTSAATLLADPTPARRDLAALDDAPRSARLRVLAEPRAIELEPHDDDEGVPAAILRKL
jgi:hypothetical protein